MKRIPIVILAIMLITVIPPGIVIGQQQDSGMYEGKKILWVDSYHQGYEWSDGIEKGIRDVLDNTGVELRIARMDTKRNDSFEFGREAGMKAHMAAMEFKPDVIIASDDNAQKYTVLPFFKNTDTPVVFCGVNWDASIYGYPYKNVTGMIEVDLTEDMVGYFKQFAKGDRIGYLSGDVESERKVSYIYNRQFFNGKMKNYLVRTFDDFKKEFLRAQKETDMLYIYNYTGIKDWDSQAAEKFISENTKISTGTHNLWMSPFVIFTLARVSEEQGSYAARTALKIMDGTKPADIPIVTNKQSNITINVKLAKASGMVIPPSMLENANVIGQETSKE